MVEHFVFNVTKLSLDQLLVAQHVVQLGRDGVAQVKYACSSATDSQDNDASQSLLTDAAPKPWL
jgi:hypothetical protein